jgi:glucose/arabinose dehydrogenase
MIDHATRAGLLVLTLVFCAGIGACDSQAAVPPAAAPAATPAVGPSENPYPEPRAPYDETPITPVETVGASRSE